MQVGKSRMRVAKLEEENPLINLIMWGFVGQYQSIYAKWRIAQPQLGGICNLEDLFILATRPSTPLILFLNILSFSFLFIFLVLVQVQYHTLSNPLDIVKICLYWTKIRL